MKVEQTECSETSAYKIRTPGNYPEENVQQCIFPYLQVVGESWKFLIVVTLY